MSILPKDWFASYNTKAKPTVDVQTLKQLQQVLTQVQAVAHQLPPEAVEEVLGLELSTKHLAGETE